MGNAGRRSGYGSALQECRCQPGSEHAITSRQAATVGRQWPIEPTAVGRPIAQRARRQLRTETDEYRGLRPIVAVCGRLSLTRIITFLETAAELDQPPWLFL